MRKFIKLLKQIKTLNLILIVVAFIAIRFNEQVLDLYKNIGSIPETYCITVILALIGECGICGMITRAKIKGQYGFIIEEEEKPNPIGFSAPAESSEAEDDDVIEETEQEEEQEGADE